MPTPSEPCSRGEWTARTDTPKRSVFGNYPAKQVGATNPTSPGAEPNNPSQTRDETHLHLPEDNRTAVDQALARSFIHRHLAQAFEDPKLDGWRRLTDVEATGLLRSAVSFLPSTLSDPAEAWLRALETGGFESFHEGYLAAFGHAARGSCPLNEIEYGDIKADPLFQPHRLADLAAFYRAFGLEVVDNAGERQDHICLEFEFMCVLAAKEAYAHERRMDIEQLDLCRATEKQFLREHLGRWTPAFARRLASGTSNPALRALAAFTRRFVESECARFGVKPGSEDLLLRPADETADRMCDACGIANLPPGATATV